MRKYKSQRDNDEYRKFRRSVLKRDSYTCQYPGCKVRNSLEVHHIKKYADHHRLRTEIFNGICLCKKHHCFVTGREEQFESLFFRTVIAHRAHPQLLGIQTPGKLGYSQELLQSWEIFDAMVIKPEINLS